MTEDEDDVLAMATADGGGAAQVVTASESGVSRLSKLAHDLLRADERTAEIERQLKEHKAYVERLQTKDLPELMRDLGVAKYEFTDGSKLSVKDDFAISIKADRREEALDWIVDHKHEGVVKVRVYAEFGKGEFDQARRFQSAAQALVNDRQVELDRSVHPMTLKSWAKELRADQDVAAADRLPVDPDGPFTVFDYSKAEVKLPKAKKQR